MNKESLYQYILLLGDNVMMFAHRLSELCGHGPSLETDIALTNISLDLFGQTRSYFQYAAKLKGEESTEDDIAFLRYENEYKNTLLAEQPNTDFAWVVIRQFLFDAYHLPLLEQLQSSKNEAIRAIANKSIKEVRYHLRFSTQWIKRLGDGTEESQQRMQDALNILWAYSGELMEETALEKEMKEAGIGADLNLVKQKFDAHVKATFAEAKLSTPEVARFQSGGKKGIHSEHMGFMLSELQYMQRAYPNMNW